MYSQYRTAPPPGSTEQPGDWVPVDHKPVTDQDNATVKIRDLMSDTEYEAQVSLDKDIPDPESPDHLDGTTKTSPRFGTLPPGVDRLWVMEVGETTATIAATMTLPIGQTTLYLIYGAIDGDWIASLEQDLQNLQGDQNNQATVEFMLTGLTSGTEYEVRISYDARLKNAVGTSVSPSQTRSVQRSVPKNDPETSVKDEEEEVPFWKTGFTTTPSPAVSSVEVLDLSDGIEITQTSATARVNVTNPNGMDEVHIRYSTDQAFQTPSTIVPDSATPGNSDAYADFGFDNLTSGTTYYVQASYDNTFQATDATKITDFITDPPTITDVEASDVEQTTVTITVTVDEPNNTPVQVHYKKTADTTWNTADPNTAVFNTTDKTYTFNLTGLTSGTPYTAYASYNTNPPTGTLNQDQTTEFTTTDPSITGVAASMVEQTTATVTVTVTAPNTTSVQLHYKTATGPWQSPKAADVVPTLNTNTGTATINLDDLTSGTEYTVYASYNTTTPQDPLNTNQKATFTTNPPSIERVAALVKDTTQTEAKMRVYIEAPNGTSQTVHLRFQSTATPEDDWGDTQSKSTGAATVDFPLENLLMATTYLVQASFADDFSSGTKETTFTTDSPDPQVGGITFKDIEQSSATAEIAVANPGTDQQTAYLHYRVEGDTGWTPDPPLSGPVTNGTAEIGLTGLTSGTRYEVQASLDSTVSTRIQSATFITAPPTVSGIEVVAGQTGGTATVTVNEPNGKADLYLRYGLTSTDPEGWSNSFRRNVNTEKVNFTLSGLEPYTEYTVHASYDIDFPGDTSATKDFRTPPLTAPNVKVTDTSQTNATVAISLTGSTGDRIVYLRYQPTQAGQQAVTKKVVMSDGSTTATLPDLRSHTQYRVDASFSGSFPPNATASEVFTTEPPSVDKVEVGNITETTAKVTITIAAPNGSEQTVSLETTPSGPWIPTDPVTTDTATATIDLTGLTAGTQYEVVATLGGDTNQVTRSATFTTASNEPGVSVVTITDESHTGATATITIANPGNVATDVHLQYQTTDPVGEWIVVQPSPSTTDADLDMAIGELTGLTSGTQYKVQASLDSTFATGVQTATFRTLRPLVSGVSVTGVSRSEATVTVGVTAPNGDPVYLQYRTGSNEWIGRYANVRTEDSSVEFTLRGLSSSTTYTVQASYDSTFDTDVESDTFTTSASQSTPRPRPRPPGGGGNTGGGNTGGGNTGGGGSNQAPEFMEGTRTVRSVVENTPSGKDIGKPIPADDPENDDLTYSLVGPDAGDFDLEDDSGQLLTRSPLDFETKTHFLVTVSVRDGMDSEGGDDTRRDDQILVAILVTDEDETPNLPPALTETPRTMRTVAENTRPGVAVGDPIEATDPEGDALTYSLNQRDGKYFDIVETSGQLLTRSPLDFETKAGYMVSVSVRDGKDTRGSEDNADDDTIMVTVVVTDQEEPGTVTLSALRPRVGIPLTAVLTDPDGGVTDVGWVWERSEDRAGWTAISDATSTAYTPTADDEGHYLRVTASYADRRGGSKTASAEPDAPVTEGIDEEFTDVDDTNVHKPAIEALASQGVFVDTECGDELFCPDLPMTRWAMAVWILRILADEPGTVVGVSRFADIDPGHWWIRYVERLADRKITIGCKLEPFRYCPDRPVTRAQMASFLVRALDLGPAPSAGFTDTDRTVHAANIDALFAAGITIGCTTEPLRYCPYEPVTRAQMATFLYRMAPRLDRQALVAIFEATGGANWKKSTNWLTDEPIGEWYGVGTDSGGRVAGLDLVDNRLNGAIPPEIVILTNLEDLKLAGNVLLGCIPEGARDIPRSDLDGYDLPYCE